MIAEPVFFYVFRQELKGMYRASSIEALARDYRERAANGTLPPDNMIPTRIIKPRRGISHAIPKPPWRTGRLAKERAR